MERILQTDVLDKALDAEVTTLAMLATLLILYVLYRVLSGKDEDEDQAQSERTALIGLLQEQTLAFKSLNDAFQANAETTRLLADRLDASNANSTRITASLDDLTQKMVDQFTALRTSFEDGFGMLLSNQKEILKTIQEKEDGSESPTVQSG